LLDDESYVIEARALFAAHGLGQIRLIAPFTIYYEIPSTLLGAVRTGRLTIEGAERSVDVFHRMSFPIIGFDRATLASLNRDAILVAHRVGCSVYDGTFLALAERLDTQVVVADDKFYNRVKDKTQRVVQLQNIELP
jgi:predicted nucleic acid-binding protein